MDSRQTQSDAKPLTEAQFLAEAPLLIHLQKRAQSATSLKEWAIARVQWAIYLARTSRIDEAANVPKDIRSRFRGNEDAEVYVWLWMLDGVLTYYRTGSTQGRLMLGRALIVSKGLRRDDLFEYASVWMAHLAYNAGDYRAMVKSLADTRLDAAKIPDAACRAALTVAVAWQLCGESDIAAKWFARARDLARSIGDRASIMASIENRALARLDRVWVESGHQMPNPGTLAQIETELSSGLSYERVTGTDALVEMGPIAKLRLLILRRDLDAALKLTEQLTFDPALSGLSMVRATSVLELWLRAELGLVERLDLEHLHRVRSSIEGVDEDDRAVCFGYLSKLALRFGYQDEAIEFDRLSKAAFDRFNSQMSELSSELVKFTDLASPRRVADPARI